MPPVLVMVSGPGAAAPFVMLPEMATAFVAASMVPPRVPSRTAFPRVTLVPACSVPPFKVSARVPSAALLPTWIVPVLIVVPPE